MGEDRRVRDISSKLPYDCRRIIYVDENRVDLSLIPWGEDTLVLAASGLPSNELMVRAEIQRLYKGKFRVSKNTRDFEFVSHSVEFTV
jgi:hypothetical protein